jgi:hypothetical protein
MRGKGTLVLAALFSGAVIAGHDGMAGPLGSPVPGAAERVVTIDAATRIIRAEHFEILAIRNAKGQSFAWRFDTRYAPTGFPLKNIAPPEFDSGDTWVYVGPADRRDR